MRTEHAAVSDTAPPVPGFLDRLGDRVRLTDRSSHVEVLRLRPELTGSPLFEPAVRRRADQLAGFLHPNCAGVRQIGRLPAPDGRLVIVSDAIDGWRLSEVIEAADQCGAAFHADAVLFLLRQLLGAVAGLHEVAPGVSHGALGTERLVITADGRLVVTESVLGAALRHLPPMPSDRLWRDLRLAVADGEAQPFGRLTDLRQIGIVALSLALGRQLRRDEYPTRLASLLHEPTPARPGRGAEVLGPALRGWLVRVLSLADDLTPWSVAEARRELNRIVESDHRYAFAPTGLPALLDTVADYYASESEVPAQVDESPAPADRKVGPVLVRKVDQPPAQEPPAPTFPGRHEPPSVPEPREVTPTAAAPPVCDAPPPVADVSQPVPEAVQAPPEVQPPAGEAPLACFEVLQTAPEVLQPAFDDFWPEPAIRPAVDQLVDSNQETLAETNPPSIFSEPAPAVAVAGPPPPFAAADEPQTPSVAAPRESRPVREPEPPVGAPAAAAAATGPARSAPALLPTATVRQVSGTGSGPEAGLAVSRARPLFGVHAAEEAPDATAPSKSRRTPTLIGIGAAAVVVLALGGYALLRPPSVAATDTRHPSSAPSSAAADTTGPAAASPVPSASRGDTQRALSTPRPAEAPPPAAAADIPAPTGSIEVVSAVPLKVSEAGRALGTSGEPIRVPVGRHTLDIGSEDLGYQTVQVVDVKPGRPQRIQPSLPTGVANLNATPWAEVWIDGRKVGETPLGHVQLTIGPHEVQFRHPELGDQTRTLMVTTGTVALLSVDLKK
jgi:hypothetical protein